MSEENLVQIEVNETEEEVAMSQEGEVSKGVYKFLSVLVFLVTVMFAWFGANMVKNLISGALSIGVRIIFIFIGFYIFYAIRIVIKSDRPLSLKEGFEIEKYELSNKYTNEELKAMTKEAKKESTQLNRSFIKFFFAIYLVGETFDLILSAILVQYIR